MNILQLRKKLANKDIVWVNGGKINDDCRYVPEEQDGKNASLVFYLKDAMCHVDNGKEIIKVPMSDRQYTNLFQTHGYK